MVNLYNRSCYTLLKSTLKIDDIIELSCHDNDGIAVLTDYEVMYGAMEFFHKCRTKNIKPIFGLEISLNINDIVSNFVLYAKNDEGFQKLMKLSTLINSKINITLEDINDKNLFIVILGCEGVFYELLINNDEKNINDYILFFKNNLYDFYIAICNNDSGFLNKKNLILKKICDTLLIKTVAISKTYYGNENDYEAYKVLSAIQQQKFIDDKSLKISDKRFFRNKLLMKKEYDENDLLNNQYIVNNCNVEMNFEKSTLPKYQNKFNVDSFYYLEQLCLAGLKKRLDGNINSEYLNRLNYELAIIKKMGYSDYFLIVYDFIAYSRNNGIYVGPGRGSAAGSLISYCLGITQVDPIKYDLLFERFLNPMRISMPDIDVDFPDNRRDEVIAYVRKKYGNKCVANITTFGTLKAKQVIRDVGKVLKISSYNIDKLCKMIPNLPKVTLKQTYTSNNNFNMLINSNKDLQLLYKLALKLEGLPRHTSLHAAGIVISGKEIDEVCPLIMINENEFATQFPMEYLEELGLIKMDFLGLRNLTIIDDIVSNVKQNNNHIINIMDLPLNDNKTIELIKKVDTVGIFQLESEGMKNLLRKLQPNSFEEIAAAIALFRPGPMENIPIYLKNRENPQNIDYMDVSLKPILKNTYGVMVYQEQVMQIVQLMGGFSLGEADILRKAISKKKVDEIKLMEKKFYDGAIKKGYSKDIVKKVFDNILMFAGYGFNKSHSIAYAMIAYQLAYLKAHYPYNFFKSLLDSVIGSEVKTSEYIFEARKRNIVILKPSVNYSMLNYNIEKKGIRFPLLGIKGISSNNISSLIYERKNNGLFIDYDDFINRMVKNKITRNVIEILIDAGALDDFNNSRASLRYNLDSRFRYAEMFSENNLFGENIADKTPFKIIKDNQQNKLELEKMVLGFYLSSHPLSKVRNEMSKNIDVISHINQIKGYVRCLGCIEKVKVCKTKRGDYMAFVVVSDETGTIDLAVMPNTYIDKQKILERGNYVYVEGKKDDRDSILVKIINKIDV